MARYWERPMTAASEPESLVIRHLQALRREIAAVAETQLLMLKKLSRHDERFAEIDRKLSEVANEVASLEIRDISWHGELFMVMPKLADVDSEDVP
jgi:hypothetical protein